MKILFQLSTILVFLPIASSFGTGTVPYTAIQNNAMSLHASNSNHSSKRRKPEGNRMAMKWVVESIDKVLRDEEKRGLREESPLDQVFIDLLYSMSAGMSLCRL